MVNVQVFLHEPSAQLQTAQLFAQWMRLWIYHVAHEG
jgi:hypothetical protein